MKRDWQATVTRVLPRRPVWERRAFGQVSWLSDRPTPHAFPARLLPDQWPHVGFVPDYSDGVAADSHRLPWGPRRRAARNTVNAQTVAPPRRRVKARGTSATRRGGVALLEFVGHR